MGYGIVIAGPTAVGKTELSIELAKEIGGVVISVDSAQVYKGFDIGTAKVTKEEMDGVKHYMIDIVEPSVNFSVGMYQKMVDEILEDLEKKNIPVVLIGGTGMYIEAITKGLSPLPKGDEKLREELSKRTLEDLNTELKTLDYEWSEKVDKNNRKRVERALEVCLLTGEKYSNLAKINIKNNNYTFIKCALTRDRKNLYERIDKRVDIMLEDGLIEEVRSLYEKYKEEIKRKHIIGYKEVIDMFINEVPYEKTVELIKRNSRRYAKKQVTWFKNQGNYRWYNVENQRLNDIKKEIIKDFKSIKTL